MRSSQRLAVRELVRRLDPAQPLGCGDEQAVVGADVEPSVAAAQRDGAAVAADLRVDDREVDADRHVRQGVGQRGRAFDDRLRPDPVGHVDHLRARRDALDDAVADADEVVLEPEVGEEGDQHAATLAGCRFDRGEQRVGVGPLRFRGDQRVRRPSPRPPSAARSQRSPRRSPSPRAPAPRSLTRRPPRPRPESAPAGAPASGRARRSRRRARRRGDGARLRQRPAEHGRRAAAARAGGRPGSPRRGRDRRGGRVRGARRRSPGQRPRSGEAAPSAAAPAPRPRCGWSRRASRTRSRRQARRRATRSR